jgi:hypothetical protein
MKGMPIIASVAVGQSVVRVRCSGLDRDPYIEKNILLVDCSELSVEDNDGKPWDTRIWSIPRDTLVSYAVGQPYVVPVVEAESAPSVAEPEFTEEQLDALRKRREELREQDRVLQEIAKERIEQRAATTKAPARKPRSSKKPAKAVEPG